VDDRKAGALLAPVTVSPLSQWHPWKSPSIVARDSARGFTVQMSFFRMLFAWWHNATLGTLWTTWLTGAPVGTDRSGNRYYQSKQGNRRWVIYNGLVEASRVPAEWHGWLHHTFADPPSTAPFETKVWEKEHRPNLTGTADAYRPEGSLLASGVRPPATGDYQAWKPE